MPRVIIEGFDALAADPHLRRNRLHPPHKQGYANAQTFLVISFVPAMAFTQVSNPSVVDSSTDPTGVACTSAAPILRYTSGGTSTYFGCTGSGGTVYAAIGSGVIIGSGSPISF